MDPIVVTLGSGELQHTYSELRHARTSKDDRGLLTIEGDGVHYGEVNQNGFLFVPGCFREGLKAVDERKPLVMGYQHHLFTPLTVIGKWPEHKDSEDGVWMKGRISDTRDGRDAATLVEDRAITGLSIAHTIETYMFLEPGQRAEFDTPYGHRSYEVDDWCMALIEGRIKECSVVHAPADDDARIDTVKHALLGKASRALPGLSAEAGWDDVAYSMALLMGGRGASSFADLPDFQHRGLYEHLAAGYRRHGKSAPAYERTPSFQHVAFQHDERQVFADRYLRKNLAAVARGAAGLEGPLSPETREEALRAITALHALTRDPEAEQLAAIVGRLRQAAQTS